MSRLIDLAANLIALALAAFIAYIFYVHYFVAPGF